MEGLVLLRGTMLLMCSLAEARMRWRRARGAAAREARGALVLLGLLPPRTMLELLDD